MELLYCFIGEFFIPIYIFVFSSHFIIFSKQFIFVNGFGNRLFFSGIKVASKLLLHKQSPHKMYMCCFTAKALERQCQRMVDLSSIQAFILESYFLVVPKEYSAACNELRKIWHSSKTTWVLYGIVFLVFQVKFAKFDS